MMNLFKKEEAKKLENILSKAADPDLGFDLAELHGFLFGLTIIPEPVMPSEWLPIVFGEDGPLFDDEKDAQASIGVLGEAYNRFMGASNRGALRFPFDYNKLSCDDLDYVEDWAYGLYEALALRPEYWGMVEETPEENLSDEMVEVIDACAVITAVAFPQERDELFQNRREEQPGTEEDMESMMFAMLPLSVEILQRHGQKLRRKMFSGGQSRPRGASKVGRNDPCPCGSGKKYKKCCGAN